MIQNETHRTHRVALLKMGFHEFFYSSVAFLMLEVDSNSSFVFSENIMLVGVLVSKGEHVRSFVPSILLAFPHDEFPILLQKFNDILTW